MSFKNQIKLECPSSAELEFRKGRREEGGGRMENGEARSEKGDGRRVAG